MTDVSTSSRQHVADTVSNAAATPEKEQPYGALGLKDDEYAKIREILGRRPTSSEHPKLSLHPAFGPNTCR